MTDLSADDKARAEDNVKKAIEKIYKQQVSSGGFSYWPNERYPDLWVTSYAGHFLIEAQKKGFAVNADVLKKWQKFEKDQAQNWYGSNADSYSSGLHLTSLRARSFSSSTGSTSSHESQTAR